MKIVRVLVLGSVFVWAGVVVSTSASVPQKTTNDGIYTKAQADAAKAQFDKMCAACHAFSVAEKKRPRDIPLGDTPFFEHWTGRPVSEIANLIALTMPNDGSAVVSDEEALNLVAYILQKNGFPAGSGPLTRESASAVVQRPKK